MTVILIAQNQATAPANNRYETDMVADYLFESIPGSQTTVFDQTPNQYNLTIETPANTTWGSNSYGQYLQINDECKVIGGRGFTKFIDAAKASGEFTIECWVAIHDPISSLAEVSEDPLYGPARLINCSDPADSTGSRNFMIGVNNWPVGDEEGVLRSRLRTSQSSFDGTPEIATAENTVNTEELRHIVLTYKQGVGQKLYSNVVAGTFAQHILSSDTEDAGNLEDWDSTYQLLLGTEHDAPRIFRGQLHRLSFHDAELTPAQVEQNYHALPSGSGVLPEPAISWRSSTYAANEWDTSFTADLDLTVPAQTATTVNLSITGSSNIFFDAGLTQTTTTVALAEGDTTATVTVYVTDTTSGGAYTGVLNVLSGTGYDIGSTAASTVTVATDNVLPVINWTTGSIDAPIDGVLNLTVTGSLPWSADNTIFMTVNSGLTTMSGGDFTFTSPTILEHDLEASFPITMNGTAADGEVLVLDILFPEVGTPGATSQVTITASDTSSDKPSADNTGPNSALYQATYGGSQTLVPWTGSTTIDDAWVAANAPTGLWENRSWSGLQFNVQNLSVDLTIRNFYADGGNNNYGFWVKGNVTGTLTIEHGEITDYGEAAVLTQFAGSSPGDGSMFTMRHIYVHDMGRDGNKLLKNSLMEKCWIERLGLDPNAHADGNQTEGFGPDNGNVTLQDNFIDMPDPLSPNGIPGTASNATSINQAKTSNINGLYMYRNWLNGGNYCTYFTMSNGWTIQNTALVDNRFGRDFKEGLLSLDSHSNFVNSGNRWDDTNELIDGTGVVASGGSAYQSERSW